MGHFPTNVGRGCLIYLFWPNLSSNFNFLGQKSQNSLKFFMKKTKWIAPKEYYLFEIAFLRKSSKLKKN